MRKASFLPTAAATLAIMLLAGLAGAQGTRTRPAGADQEARREWMKEHRGEAKERWEALTPEQRDVFKAHRTAYNAERKSMMAQVKAGTLDKKTAAEKLKAWREAHKPTKP